jgi:hypothetical protein
MRRLLTFLAPSFALLAACSSGNDPNPRSPGGADPGADAAAVDGGAEPAEAGGDGPTADVTPPTPDSGADAHAPSKVKIFVAQGSLGRTTISCDDGRTWVGNHSWDIDGDPLLCGKKQSGICYGTGTCSYTIDQQCVDRQCCNDTPDVAKGVAFGNGTLVATWGWGSPGAVRRSVNGIDWVTTHSNDSFGGLAFGGGRFVAASRAPFYSTDGTAWTAGGAADFRNADGTIMWSVRRFAYADVAGGRFVAVASGDTSNDMLVSSDGGVTWWRPSVRPATCATAVSTYGGIVSGNGVIVIVSQDATACRSTDGGKTWSVSPTGLTQILSHGVWTGTEFRFWGDDMYMVSSADGATWTKTPMATPTRLGPVARSDGGTLVAVGNVWEGYDQQTFYRSTDGLTWDKLPPTAFVPSHGIFYIAYGEAEPSPACHN